MAVRVKICGMREPEDARVAAEAGADYIGMVFVPERRRRVSLDEARRIVDAVRALDGEAPRTVGLFADQPIEEVNETVDYCGLDGVQLCGQEDLGYASEVASQVIKVVHVPAFARSMDDIPEQAQRVRDFTEAGHTVTLDRLVEGIQGGTGQSFSVDVAASLARRGPSFLLAGGLTPANVGRIISVVRPWGVDVSSGIETLGRKDHGKIRRFITNAREADAALAGSA